MKDWTEDSQQTSDTADPWTSTVWTQSGTIPALQVADLITNADQGVYYSWDLVLNGAVSPQLTTIDSAGNVATAPLALPGSFAPVLQQEDGSLVGTLSIPPDPSGQGGEQLMVAMNASGMPKWSIPNYNPEYAQADESVVATSLDGLNSLILDQSGNAAIKQQAAGDQGSVYSWHDNWYIQSGGILEKVSLAGISLASTWAAILGGNPSLTPVAVQQPLFAQLDSCIDTNVTPPPPCPGFREAIWNGEKALVKTLSTDVCKSTAQTAVFNKLSQKPGLTTQQLLAYLQNKMPQFYDGTKSKAAVTSFCQGSSGLIYVKCFFATLNNKATTISDYFANNPGTLAATIGGNDPLIVFFRPSVDAISFQNGGANIDNEAEVFHEALHGFTNLLDNQIEQDLLNISGQPSDVIDQYLIQNVFGVCATN